ncbi:MAG: aldose 1-epimerase [Acidimicrobiia bacterium]
MSRLEAGPARLEYAPERGGRLVSLTVDGLDLLFTPSVDDHNFGAFPMAPWAGRVRRGCFTFAGRDYELPCNHPPHAIHGVARDHPWRDERGGVMSVDLPPPWPFGGNVVQRLDLTPDALTMTMEVHAGERPMPASCGWHPWWARHLGRGEPLELDLHAGAMYRKDDDDIAVDELVPIGPHPWDDCFTELGDPPAVLRWPGAITLTLETSCPCVVAFDQPENAICVEPQTHPPDALNLGPAVVMPGEPLVASCRWSWEVA